jgi:surfeit locus 1 family protein
MPASHLRPLLVPAVAALAALAVLLSLGFWQLERKAWKEGLIAQIEARAYGEPGDILPERSWAEWNRAAEEYRRVRLTGTFLHEHETPVHGLMAATRGQPVQGFYLLTPLRLRDGAIVVVNRGFVPTPLRDPTRRSESQPPGEVTVTGLVRAPETRARFVPENDPSRQTWFVRDPAAIAATRGLTRVAPFLIDADAIPNPGDWPKGGQTRLALPNDHLAYAVTWFGIAGTLVGVFIAFAWRRMRPLVPPALPT